MKLLITYDGSENAANGIDDLGRAGLPIDAQALVVSVAEVWLPPSDAAEPAVPAHVPEAVERWRAAAAQLVKHAGELAEHGSKRVREIFPHWTVTHTGASGSPAHEILNIAREWDPDLIVVGSRGLGALGRLVLGSVSQKVLTEAETSVRIARPAAGSGASAIRIVAGVDGSEGANAALRTVAQRNWTTGSEVRVIVVRDSLAANSAARLFPPLNEFVEEVNQTEHKTAERIADEAVKELNANLRGKDVTVSSAVMTGDPRQVIVRAAEEFGADCIFTGATGFSNPIDRFLVGSVSAAVAARAHCSVEVVKVPRR